jgi:hypothetical protein
MERDSVSVKVPKFNGEDHAKWVQFEDALDGEACQKNFVGPLDGPRPAGLENGTDAEKAARGRAITQWEKANMFVYGVLISNATGSAKTIIRAFRGERDGRGAYLAMKAKFEKTGIAAGLKIELQLEDLRLRLGDDPREHFGVFRECIAKMKDFGLKVDDDSIPRRLIKSLDAHHVDFIAQLAGLAGGVDKLTQELIETAITEQYDLSTPKRKGDEAKALIGGVRGHGYRKQHGRHQNDHAREPREETRRCHRCGVRGHLVAACTEKGTCTGCGVVGHLQENCKHVKP